MTAQAAKTRKSKVDDKTKNESPTMGGATTRGPLQRPRLGLLQQRILSMLYHQWLEGTSVESKGMTQAALLGALYDCAVWRDRQWLPMVYTQILREKGQVQEATDILLRSLVRIAELRRDALTEAVATYESLDSSTGKPHEAQLVHYARLSLLAARRQFNQIRMLQRTLGDDEFTDSERYDLAGQLAFEVIGAAGIMQGDALLKGAHELPDGGEELARAELAKRQASLSRALRSLREHGLVQRQEVPALFHEESSGETEAKFFISPNELERIRDGKKG